MSMIKRMINIIERHILFRDLGYKLVNPTIFGRVYVFNKNTTIGSNAHIYPNVTFMGNGSIRIGNNVKIGNNVCICSSIGGGVEIGDNTLIAANCYIIDSNHGVKKDICIQQQDSAVEKVIIGSDVWLGNDVTVLKGSIIEDGVVVGAKSLVNRRLTKDAICWGIPAKEMRVRE